MGMNLNNGPPDPLIMEMYRESRRQLQEAEAREKRLEAHLTSVISMMGSRNNHREIHIPSHFSKFGGEDISFSDWVNQVETTFYKEIQDMPNPAFFQCLSSLIVDKHPAKAAINRYLASVGMENATWIAVKEVLISLFNMYESQFEIYKKFVQLEMGDHNLVQYIMEHNSLMGRINDTFCNTTKLSSFILGLRPDIRKHVLLKNPSQLQEAIEAAQQFVAATPKRGQKRKMEMEFNKSIDCNATKLTNRRCLRCGNRNHTFQLSTALPTKIKWRRGFNI